MHISMSNAEEIEGSDDLLITILLFLPAKPLFAFKLVSKRWLSLISDPRFSSLWKPETLPSAIILQLCHIRDPCFIPLKDNAAFKASQGVLDFVKGIRHDKVEVLNSCGGLILCRIRDLIYCPIRDKYIVCNPTTKQFNTLPSPNVYPKDMCLAFDHSISPHYKVISVGSLQIEVFSSETNSWRMSRAQFPESCSRLVDYRLLNKGVFFKGAIFWMIKQLSSFCYFDIDRDVLHHSYPMPKLGEMYYYYGCAYGKLHLVGTSDGHTIDVFVLGNDRYSWDLKYRFDHFSRKLYYTKYQQGASLVEFQTAVIPLMPREGNQEPYLILYMPLKVKSIDMMWNYYKDYSPSVHHVIENPFWIGSRLRRA